MEFDLAYIEFASGFKKNIRTQLNNYYSNLPEEVKIQVLKLQWDLLRKKNKIKIKGKEAEFYYSMFLLAIQKFQLLESAPSRKCSKASKDELEQIHYIRSSRIKFNKKQRPSKARKIIEVRFFDVITRLRGEGMSWRDISRYIALYHKVKLSHSHISVIYKQIVTEREI